MRLIILLLWLALPTLFARPANSGSAIIDTKAIARIEGPIQGTGTLFKLNQKIVVLTAWHVLKGVREGEEVDVVLVDGRTGSIDFKSIKRIGNVDMAIADVSLIRAIPDILVATEPATIGTEARVFGYPIDSNGQLVSTSGSIFSNSNIGIDQGYQLIYSMETRPGMSGGPVIDKIGNIIGIHGRGELNQFQSDYKDKIVKTRLNNGVPISYFISYLRGEETSYIPQEPKSIDDLNALTYREWRTKRDHGGEKGIKYTSLLIELLHELESSDFRRQLLLHDVYQRRSDIKFRQGRYKEAISDIDKAIEFASDDETKDLYHLGRVSILEASGQTILAIDERTKLIERHPNDPSNYRLRGHGFLLLGFYQKALRDFLKVLELGEINSDSYHSIALAYSNLNNIEASMQYNQMALDLNPAHLVSLKMKSFLLQKIPGRDEEALNAALKALNYSEKDVDKLNALDEVFSIYFERQDLKAAESILSRMQAISPKSHRYLSSSARFYSHTNQHKKAIKQLTISIDNNPPKFSLPFLYERRGRNWQKLKEHEKAIAEFNHAISIGDKGFRKFAYSSRGHSFASLGNFTLACADWKKSVKMGGEFDGDFIDDFCE